MCMAEGIPRPTIKWSRKDGLPLPLAHRWGWQLYIYIYDGWVVHIYTYIYSIYEAYTLVGVSMTMTDAPALAIAITKKDLFQAGS